MKKILVADDDTVVRFTVVEMLKELGYSTIEASNGKRAWEILSDNSDIDVLITDMLMPDLMGRELIQLLRGTARFKHLPVILMSAVVTVNEIADLLELGAARFLPKPVSASFLREYLESIMKKKEKNEIFLQSDSDMSPKMRSR